MANANRFLALCVFLGLVSAGSTGPGEKLWEYRLPAGGQATPMSYVSEKT